jgi:hypothetical protein
MNWMKEISDPQEDIEAAGVYQESPVQIRDSPEDQAAQGGVNFCTNKPAANETDAG